MTLARKFVVLSGNINSYALSYHYIKYGVVGLALFFVLKHCTFVNRLLNLETLCRRKLILLVCVGSANVLAGELPTYTDVINSTH